MCDNRCRTSANVADNIVTTFVGFIQNIVIIIWTLMSGAGSLQMTQKIVIVIRCLLKAMLIFLLFESSRLSSFGYPTILILMRLCPYSFLKAINNIILFGSSRRIVSTNNFTATMRRTCPDTMMLYLFTFWIVATT